ncbi:hypothetical protein IE53DRAFT_207176 [Violaceomyces palustris]|uniref:Uncharacterized protein n=1 Tax=Violaceomyces palustris TaxID=1673888 RepID=A0ACD0NR05_9BASI|nr:hypothetical protein IE53DRAFT_207176 [Violaceomyces palustris]
MKKEREGVWLVRNSSFSTFARTSKTNSLPPAISAYLFEKDRPSTDLAFLRVVPVDIGTWSSSSCEETRRKDARKGKSARRKPCTLPQVVVVMLLAFFLLLISSSPVGSAPSGDERVDEQQALLLRPEETNQADLVGTKRLDAADAAARERGPSRDFSSSYLQRGSDDRDARSGSLPLPKLLQGEGLGLSPRLMEVEYEDVYEYDLSLLTRGRDGEGAQLVVDQCRSRSLFDDRGLKALECQILPEEQRFECLKMGEANRTSEQSRRRQGPLYCSKVRNLIKVHCFLQRDGIELRRQGESEGARLFRALCERR